MVVCTEEVIRAILSAIGISDFICFECFFIELSGISIDGNN